MGLFDSSSRQVVIERRRVPLFPVVRLDEQPFRRIRYLDMTNSDCRSRWGCFADYNVCISTGMPDYCTGFEFVNLHASSIPRIDILAQAC